jgi:hypothetical protein
MATPPPFTCESVPLQHRQTWLERELHFIREGNEVRLEVLNERNGRVFMQAKIDILEFERISKAMLRKPGD